MKTIIQEAIEIMLKVVDELKALKEEIRILNKMNNTSKEIIEKQDLLVKSLKENQK